MMVKYVAFAVTMDIDTRNIDILAMPFAAIVSLPLQKHTLTMMFFCRFRQQQQGNHETISFLPCRFLPCISG
jgi:hypothetical protein